MNRVIKRLSVALVVVLAVAVVVVSWSFTTRPGSGTPGRFVEEVWIPVGTPEEIKSLENPSGVVYMGDHDLFVVTMANEPEGFVALSARTTVEGKTGEGRRMLFCTISNLFENEHGDVFDRAGRPLVFGSATPLPKIDLRVRDGVIEVAPLRIVRHDLKAFGGPHGPPCGLWGEVEEGPAGFALATDAPAGEQRASINPRKLRPGQRAELYIRAGRHTSGLSWSLHRLQENGLWQWWGIFVGGPGYRSYFDIAPLDSGGIDDIGFGGNYSMNIRIPKELEPGTYRLVTESITDERNKPVHERLIWHYTDFEVVATSDSDA